MTNRKVKAKRSFRVRLVPVLDLLTAALAVGAVLLAFLPEGKPGPRSSDGTTPPSTFDASLPPRGNASADSIMQSIIRTNVLSSTRREPRTHFLPPGSDAGGGASMSLYEPASRTSRELPTEEIAGDTDRGESERVPGLSGIVFVDGAPLALLVLKAGEPPRLFAIGDMHGGYRVQAIDRDRVVLSAGGARTTLRIRQPLRRDSLAVDQ